jgi:RNA polymerase sigma-70 factor, ECF subfamily
MPGGENVSSERLAESAFRDAFEKHRPQLLRHCYRMMGSFTDAEDAIQEVLAKAWAARGSYVPTAPILHWLMRIATTTCLKALASRKTRSLPQLTTRPLDAGGVYEQSEPDTWVTPAPDSLMFKSPDEATEVRESVAIAFIALLQRLPPKQRAALLLKDVVGWSAEEIAEALELSTSAVNSALHRARETIGAQPKTHAEEPPPEFLQQYIRAWETRDVHGLVALLKNDVVLAMPPWATWVRGAENVRAFYEVPSREEAWRKGFSGMLTRANGCPAIVWYRPESDGVFRPHRLELIRFADGLIAESIHFVGPEYRKGFDIPAEMHR